MYSVSIRACCNGQRVGGEVFVLLELSNLSIMDVGSRVGMDATFVNYIYNNTHAVSIVDLRGKFHYCIDN